MIEPRFLLVKRDLYYRPDACGYTGIKDHAGRYHEDEAEPESGVTAIHEDDAPEFSKGCWDDVARRHLQKKIARLRDAATQVLDRMTSTYRARNGREVGIQGDDGEKCWIIHSDDIEALRAALEPSEAA